ncbi:hypothetical protein GOHSU_08_00180 [Gordonia hirsuta DSM 44140 = NBRC 16056]|uniref:Uncharacterized protein n=1 Tax=Gordonia hirsuta DSM 44140 = NBRC 16056 TaxID=1121927 RepID=L7L5U5_9ACTN|nr:hypothetical protein [Gordonia hirsuta]GAC56490.1 hypothetical protein GOHSU_08_00180 [Gordonia hirsuta DSM 44140 = NBRC 16056]
MESGNDDAVRRWRAARAARDRARDQLTEAELEAGLRRRLPAALRLTLVLVAVLAVAGAAVAWWQVVRGPQYSDDQLVDAAVSRVQLVLSADADDPGRARKILAGATGEFHDTFAQSAQAYTRYIELQGTRGSAAVDGAALAYRDGDRAMVLVAATLSMAGAAGAGESGEAGGRPLRLRVVVEPDEGMLKLSGVTFLS